MRAYAHQYRTTLLCIDSYENGVPAGRMYNPALEEGAAFQSLTQLLRQMEGLLDTLEFPQPFNAPRRFAAPPPLPGDAPAASAERSGRLATFAVQIFFRRNASWQGSVSWLEGRQDSPFRSAMELVLLMDSALLGQTLRGKEPPAEGEA